MAKRFRGTTPDDLSVLSSRSRARKTPPLSPLVIARILELRDPDTRLVYRDLDVKLFALHRDMDWDDAVIRKLAQSYYGLSLSQANRRHYEHVNPIPIILTTSADRASSIAYTAAQQLAILAEYESYGHGDPRRGELPRRVGAYTSHSSKRRDQRNRGTLTSQTAPAVGRPKKPRDPQQEEIARLRCYAGPPPGRAGQGHDRD